MVLLLPPTAAHWIGLRQMMAGRANFVKMCFAAPQLCSLGRSATSRARVSLDQVEITVFLAVADVSIGTVAVLI